MKLSIPNNMEKLVILDFNTGEVHIYNMDMKVKCVEDLISKLGHRANDCQLMFTSNDIIFHGEILK